MSDSSPNPLKIRVRGEDGFRVTTIRISEELLRCLDELSAKTRHSRNELINIMLEYAVGNIVIEQTSKRPGEESKPF